MAKQEIEVTFNDLSTSLKVLVVFGWIIVGFFVLAFMSGFIAGMLGA